MDTLTPETILDRLGASIPAEVLCFGQVGSTMDLARERLAAGAVSSALLVLAEEQTAGRGRKGRTWIAPPGSALLCSLALRPAWLPPARASTLVWMAATAACEAIAATTGLQPRLKWPNDVLLPARAGASDPAWRKVAGILLELNLSGIQLDWAIIGCGINVSASPPAEPGLRYPAIDLAAARGQPVARLPLLRALLTRLDHWYNALQRGAYDQLFAAWRALLVTPGTQVQVETAAGILAGYAEDVDSSGSLLVRDATGQLHVVSHGDVS